MSETYLFLSLLGVYCAAIAIGGWFVLHAQHRQQWQHRIHSLAGRIGTRLQKTLGGLFTGTSQAQSRIQNVINAILAAALQHKRTVFATIIILAMSVILTLALKPHYALEGYDDLPQTTDPVIVALLRGEQLVPPPPLPPEVFVTKEVEAIRQALSGASREWMVLDADFRQRLLTVFQLMAQRGYQMALIEGYRSPERQAFLATLGSHVTNAGAYQSYHQYGLAADSAFFRNGKIVISEKDPWAMEGYRLYGEYAESVGLVWGGRWKMMDFGHVELRKAKVLARHQEKL